MVKLGKGRDHKETLGPRQNSVKYYGDNYYIPMKHDNCEIEC